MSASWQPFQIRGAWNDSWARNELSFNGRGYAKRMFEEFSKLVSRGSMVRVEMSFIWIEGLITEFTPRYHNDNFIEWEFTLSPHNVNDFFVTDALVAEPSITPSREHVAQIEDFMEELQGDLDAAADIPMSDNSWPEMAAEFGSIDRDTHAARLAADSGIGDDPVRGLRSLAAKFRGIRDSAHRAQLQAIKLRSDLQLAFDDAMVTLRFESWAKDTARGCRLLALRSGAAERDALAQAEAKPRAVHRPYAGETLYQISAKYYGTPDHWRAIYAKNRLTSIRLDGTEELIIPERAA